MVSKKIASWFRERPSLSSIARLVSGNALAHLITLASLPIVTRIYSPEEIGVISIFVAFIGFWGAIATLRLESASLVADRQELPVLLSASIRIALIVSLSGAVCAYFLVEMSVFGFEVLPEYSPYFVAPVIFTFGFMMAFRSAALRYGQFREIAGAAWIRSAVNASTRILLFPLGLTGLFLAELFGHASAGLKLLLRKSEELSLTAKRQEGRHLSSVIMRFRKFTFLETPSVMVNQAAILIPLPAIAGLHGAAAAGWFGLARMAVSLPNAQIGKAVADVYQSESAALVREKQFSHLREHFFRYLGRLALIGALPLIAFVLLAPPLVPFIFGEEWRPMGWIAAVIAPWFYAAFVVGGLSRLLLVTSRQELKLAYDLLVLSAFIVVTVLAQLYELPLFWTTVAFSVAAVCSYLVYLLILLFLVRSVSARAS